MSSTDPVLDRVFQCAQAAADKRGSDIVILGVEQLTSYTDYVLLVSASSDRRVKTIAESIRAEMKDEGVIPLGVEGLNESQWVLLDFGPWIIHVFYEEMRPVFDLEGLWADGKRITLPDEVVKAMQDSAEDEF